MKIMVVDDHILFREGLTSLFARQTDMTLVGECGTVAEAVKLVRQTAPDLVLMDFNLPDGTGVDATRMILAERPDIKIVFLTVNEDEESLLAAVRMGAQGFLLKNIPVARLLAALRGVQRGEAAISREMTGRLMRAVSQRALSPEDGPNPLHSLSSRELEVLRHLASGASNQEIAVRLVISENTVRNHVHNILEKLEVHKRREAVILAQRYGLTPADRPE